MLRAVCVCAEWSQKNNTSVWLHVSVNVQSRLKRLPCIKCLRVLLHPHSHINVCVGMHAVKCACVCVNVHHPPTLSAVELCNPQGENPLRVCVCLSLKEGVHLKCFCVSEQLRAVMSWKSHQYLLYFKAHSVVFPFTLCLNYIAYKKQALCRLCV